MLTLENIKPRVKEYSKVHSDQMQERHEAIIALLKRNKQMTTRELSNATGLASKTIQYAMKPLLDRKQVYRTASPFSTRIYYYTLKPVINSDDMEFIRYVKDGATCDQVAYEAGLSKSTAYKRLEKMRLAGKIKRHKANTGKCGKLYIYTLT